MTDTQWQWFLYLLFVEHEMHDTQCIDTDEQASHWYYLANESDSAQHMVPRKYWAYICKLCV